MTDRYTHGHHESVLKSHLQRTASNSAGYLLEHLEPGMTLLDVGCGPGNITADLARVVSPAEVVGMDASADVVALATASVPEESTNLRFEVADTYDLPWADDSFDVLHAHQVLQHLTDPVAALCEMRRVLRPGGLLGVRDADYRAFMWSPSDPLLDRWLELYHQVTESNDAEADAGRHLLAWVTEAGFGDAEYSTSNWTWCSEDERRWWGGLWAERVLESDFAAQAREQGLSDMEEQTRISDAFLRWSEQPSAVWVVPNGEVLARA